MLLLVARMHLSSPTHSVHGLWWLAKVSLMIQDTIEKLSNSSIEKQRMPEFHYSVWGLVLVFQSHPISKKSLSPIPHRSMSGSHRGSWGLSWHIRLEPAACLTPRTCPQQEGGMLSRKCGRPDFRQLEKHHCVSQWKVSMTSTVTLKKKKMGWGRMFFFSPLREICLRKTLHSF